MAEKKIMWKDQRDGFSESLFYLSGRMKGTIKSIRTPWESWNRASTDGLEWNSTTVIGGRPSTGKTLIKDQLITEAFKLNPGADFRVLEFQFEMLAKNSAIREYSRLLGKPYKYLCSAEEKKLTQEDLDKCHIHAKERVKYPINVVEEPCTVVEFIQIIKDYMETYSTIETITPTPTEKNLTPTPYQLKVYKKTIVTLDHSLLLKKGTGEKDKFDTLYNLGEALTALKRAYPIAFIILSQLSRGIDSVERNEDGKPGNYILTSDIFGADALLQHADFLIGLNRPGQRNIKFYGPERYIIVSPDIMVTHFLKCRNGETGMSFFLCEFNKMKITEIPKPGTQQKRVST